MRARRAPNIRLRRLLDETGWTGRDLAEAVNTASGEAGTATHYDRTTVAHWLSGTRPPLPIARYVAEGFSRRLGCTVTVEDTGLAPLPARPALATPDGPNPVTALAELAAADRRTRLHTRGYNLASARHPAFDELPPPRSCRDPTGTERVGTVHLELAATMLGVFSDTDMAFGGGRARHALSSFLGTTVHPWLHNPAGPRLHLRLLGAAADLAYLAGFMCFDDQLHGAAQRYYLAAARLAAAARDRARYATVLRAMSVQANALTHHREALHLAEHAVRGIASAEPRSAFLHGQLAVASAAVGDRRAAVRHLATAERHLERASGDAAIGVYHRSTLAHQHADVHIHLGELPAAVDQLVRSLRHRPTVERRSRALTTAKLAELHLRMGHVEQACFHWQRFLVDRPLLHSARADTALRVLHTTLRPYSPAVPAARGLLAQADEPRRRSTGRA